MKSFVILIALVVLELFIFPIYNLRENPKILSRSSLHFLGIVNSVFSIRDTLKNYNKNWTILVIFVNYFFGKFLISQFYDFKTRYFDSMHSIVIILISMIPFVYFTKKEDFEQFENSTVVKKYIHQILSEIISVNQLFYFYKLFHLKHGNIVEYCFNRELVIHFVVDFLSTSFSYVMNNTLCIFLSEDKNKFKYFSNIFKKFFLMVLANLAFYSIYSFQMSKKIFEISFDNLSSPHNLILYNMLPKDLDQRFRLSLFFLNWLIF
jgi:hypothetical protein